MVAATLGSDLGGESIPKPRGREIGGNKPPWCAVRHLIGVQQVAARCVKLMAPKKDLHYATVSHRVKRGIKKEIVAMIPGTSKLMYTTGDNSQGIGKPRRCVSLECGVFHIKTRIQQH